MQGTLYSYPGQYGLMKVLFNAWRLQQGYFWKETRVFVQKINTTVCGFPWRSTTRISTHTVSC